DRPAARSITAPATAPGTTVGSWIAWPMPVATLQSTARRPHGSDFSAGFSCAGSEGAGAGGAGVVSVTGGTSSVGGGGSAGVGGPVTWLHAGQLRKKTSPRMVPVSKRDRLLLR